MLLLAKTFVRVIYGLGFLVGGFLLLFSSFFTGLMLMICGAFLFKPTSQLIEKKLKRTLNRSVKISIVLATGFIGVIGLANMMMEKGEAIKKQEADQFAELPQYVKDSILAVRQKEQQAQADQNVVEERKEKIEALFSPYDGSNQAVTEYLKKNLDDPDSYEHIETSWKAYPAYLIVYTSFRANNRFGAKIKQSIKVKVSFDNEILDILAIE